MRKETWRIERKAKDNLEVKIDNTTFNFYPLEADLYIKGRDEKKAVFTPKAKKAADTYFYKNYKHGLERNFVVCQISVAIGCSGVFILEYLNII